MCKHFTEHISLSIIISIFISISIIQAQVDTLWTKTFGGSGDEVGRSVQPTIDGGYIIAGETYSFGAGQDDVWLIKTNAYGDTLWTKTFGESGAENGNSVQQTEDEGYIITGSLDSLGLENHDVWLIKTNAVGDTLWTKTYGGNGDDRGSSVQQTNDEGYIITGYTTSFGTGGYDVWLIKTNATGDTLWTKTFGGYSDEFGFSVQQTIDGGYIIVGDTYSFGVNGDVWLIKTNATGDVLWIKTFGGNGNDQGLEAQQTGDEGYIITGFTSSFGTGGYDVWLIKVDASGDTLWTMTFGGSVDDHGSSVQQTIDGGYIIAGSTYPIGAETSDVLLIKTTPDVNTVKKTNFNPFSDYALSPNFPNPFNLETTFKYSILKSDQITISIYTISGQVIESKTMNLNPGSYNYEFDGSRFSTGIYFYKISTSSGFTTGRKMLLIK